MRLNVGASDAVPLERHQSLVVVGVFVLLLEQGCAIARGWLTWQMQRVGGWLS